MVVYFQPVMLVNSGMAGGFRGCLGVGVDAFTKMFKGYPQKMPWATKEKES